ncbi:hypothetical protein HW555_002094 [Spodoptera exigua]|uniref:DUF659 domain-containing protein n=1 Tax=Spodoptera exigua TaxID=7107 RepID=A0A835GSP8_SPOEX|nr:hypothetical protein HW555_002094 [Spodoptera exigua]
MVILYMVLTAAERSKRYREKIKQDPVKHELHKKKELKRLKKHFKKINELTEEEKDARRKRWREQKRNQKENKKKSLEQGDAAARQQLASTEQQLSVTGNAVPPLNNIRKKLYRAKKRHEKEMHLLQTQNDKLKARQEVMEVAIREAYTNCKKNPEKRVIKSDKMNTKPERNLLGLKGQVRKTNFKCRPLNKCIVEDLEKFYNRDDISRSTAGPSLISSPESSISLLQTDFLIDESCPFLEVTEALPLVVSPKYSTPPTPHLPSTVQGIHKNLDSDPIQLASPIKKVKVLKPLQVPFEEYANKPQSKPSNILQEQVENQNIIIGKRNASSRTFPCHDHTGQYIQECWKEICEEFEIDKNKIVSITTDGGSNIVSAVRLFLGDNHQIPCMAHVLNVVVEGHLPIISKPFQSTLWINYELNKNHVGKKEGEVLTLIQAVITRWNPCFDMLERFVKLSALVAKILVTKSQTNKNTPDMVPSSQLNVTRDFIALLGPFKEATEEISGANYVTSSLAIPLTALVTQVTDQATPSTSLGLVVKKALLKKVEEKLAPLERNSFLSVATILDPRFKCIQLSCQMLNPKLVLRFKQNIGVEDNVLRIKILIKQHQNKLVGPLSG